MTKSQKQIYIFIALFFLVVSITICGLVIYRNCILNNSILEYEVLDYYKKLGRTTSSIMEIEYNGIISNISISEESYNGLEQGIKPLVFYNSEFDDPFTFFHCIIFLKFLGGIFIIGGFVAIIFLFIDWRTKLIVHKALMFVLVLSCGLFGYYFLSFERREISTRVIAYSSKYETTLFSSLEIDSVTYWTKSFLPTSYEYEGVYKAHYYPDLFLGNQTFLSHITGCDESLLVGQRKIFYGHLSAFNADKVIDLGSEDIVNITIDDGSTRAKLNCSGGFFCIELPVSQTVNIWFNLKGYKTKQVTILFSSNSDNIYATANCIFNIGEGIEKTEFNF
jgi:hypothetical protein